MTVVLVGLSVLIIGESDGMAAYTQEPRIRGMRVAAARSDIVVRLSVEYLGRLVSISMSRDDAKNKLTW